MFDYPVPYNQELRELYPTPYRFSEKLTNYADYMFNHPYNTHHKIYSNLKKPTDANDMVKVAYLVTKHYLDYPQQYGHSLDNISAAIIVRMWKSFINLHKHLRYVQFDKHMPTKMKILTIGEGMFFDILLEDIRTNNFIMHADHMVKKRKGIGLRERQGYSEQHMHYLCSLD